MGHVKKSFQAYEGLLLSTENVQLFCSQHRQFLMTSRKSLTKPMRPVWSTCAASFSWQVIHPNTSLVDWIICCNLRISQVPAPFFLGACKMERLSGTCPMDSNESFGKPWKSFAYVCIGIWCACDRERTTCLLPSCHPRWSSRIVFRIVSVALTDFARSSFLKSCERLRLV